MSTSFRYGSFRCGWTRGVQVKLWDPLRTRAILERLRGVITTRRYTNPRLPLPNIANECLSQDTNNYVCQTSTHAKCSKPTHVLAITHSLLLDLKYETVCQSSCESCTLHFDNFDEDSKHIYTVFQKKHPLILLAISWGIVVRF